jgi:CheY-like chemotaxis protein
MSLSFAQSLPFSAPVSRKQMTILAVDDDPLALAFLEAQVATLGHRIITAIDGKAALDILQQSRHIIDIVLMDKEMPILDGFSAMAQMKENATLRNIPVIMITGADSMEEIQQGLEAGVFYYLTKPVKQEMLRSVLQAAIADVEQSALLAEELHKHRTSFHLIDTCRFSYKTLAEAESLAAFMANCFPNPKRVLLGLGELMINAVEHGNLCIGYKRKSELVAAGTWREEIERRANLDEYSDKTITATIAKKTDGIYLVVEDMGNGFDWQRYMHIDPARAADNHGRGIALANATSFDRLTYNEKGNKVIGFVAHDKKLDW